MTDSSFTFLATVSCSTKRASLTGGYAANLSGLKCYPLAPVSPETQKRLELNTPHMVFETFLQGNPDIKKGDLLVIGTVEYPIRSAAPWEFYSDTRVHLVVEDLRN